MGEITTPDKLHTTASHCAYHTIPYHTRSYITIMGRSLAWGDMELGQEQERTKEISKAPGK